MATIRRRPSLQSPQPRITPGAVKDPYQLVRILEDLSRGLSENVDAINNRMARVESDVSQTSGAVDDIEDDIEDIDDFFTAHKTLGVDLTSTGETTLLTAAASWITTNIIIIEKTASGVTVVPSVSATTGGAPILPPPRMLLGAGTAPVGSNIWCFPTQGRSRIALAGESVVLSVDTAATATALTADVHLIGYYL